MGSRAPAKKEISCRITRTLITYVREMNGSLGNLLDGLIATKIIKADPVLKDIPIFALTGFAMESGKEKAEDIGFAGYIVKPISVKGLLETLANCFTSQQTKK